MFFFFDFFPIFSFHHHSQLLPTHHQIEIKIKKREREREKLKRIFENDMDTDSCIHIDKGCDIDNAGCALDDYDMDETSTKT